MLKKLMRLWSLHPKYLDAKGLIALWREALLAQKVLQGRTQGYRYHPQLQRFQNTAEPVVTIAFYLTVILEEAQKRHYQFNATKIALHHPIDTPIMVTQGQIHYEWAHLHTKLMQRNKNLLKSLQTVTIPDIHPIFQMIAGPVEPWEKRYYETV